jgi:fatty acid desaturase
MVFEKLSIIPLRYSYWRIITAIERKSKVMSLIALISFPLLVGYILGFLAFTYSPIIWILIGVWFFWFICSEYTSVYWENFECNPPTKKERNELCNGSDKLGSVK